MRRQVIGTDRTSTAPRQADLLLLLAIVVGAGRLLRLVQVLPRGAAARLGHGDAGDALQVRLDRRASATPAFRTGSSTCCRACSRRSCPGPAATRRSACRGSRARSCRSASPRRRSAFRAWQTTAPCATRRAIASSAERESDFVAAGPGHTLNVEAFFRFLVDCAKDPRFNADNLMREINLVTDLVVDRQAALPLPSSSRSPRSACSSASSSSPGSTARISRLGPRARRRHEPHQVLHDQAADGRHLRPDRHAVDLEPARSTSRSKGTRMNCAGDSHDAVFGDHRFRARLARRRAARQGRISRRGEVAARIPRATKPPPKYPFPIDAAKAAQGKAVFDAQLRALPRERAHRHAHADRRGRHRSRPARHLEQASRHRSEQSRAATWASSARAWSKRISNGYIAPFLDGIWLRAPYLHNGSVPTLRDLLKPAAERPKVFCRGYDFYDPVNVGFVSQGVEAQRIGTRFDVESKSGGNQGHEFGTTLSTKDKDALLEYLKTL